ncbi:MAG: glycosyltransferase [Ruminococcus sp.]|nr:glycosyltransferase [Ruminococcus sp.]
MNIYIIPAWYPQDDNDITASFFREQAHALSERGHNVTVIHIELLSVTGVFSRPWHSKRTWQDKNVRTIFHKVIVPVPAKFSKAQDKYVSNLFYKIIRKQMQEDKKQGIAPDLIHAHVSHSCAYYCVEPAKRLGLPLVVTEHYSGLVLGIASEKEYNKVAYTINNSDAFIFVGSNFQEFLCNKLGISKKTYVIPNMIDTNNYEVGSKTNEVFTFLTACHLKTHKSVDLVVKALHKAFHNDENVKLMIAGDGDEYDNLKSLIEELNEESRISMFGRYSREQSKELFSKADTFVLTSKAETFGIVYIEALASGVPCIGTKGQGADDIIDESNGFTVDYGDVDQLAERMQELYKNRELYKREEIRQACVDKFDKSSVCEKIEEVYKVILINGE